MQSASILAGLVGSLCAMGILGLSAVEGADPPEHEFIGLKKCSMCHKKEATGNQLAVWQEGPHARAYEVLASEEAVSAAKKLGIENPQEAPECLKCHVTAFPVMSDLANQKITMEEGVSCESCHGAGSGYYKKKTMQAIAAGEIEPASVGLVIPDEATCVGCHNPEGNPFHKEFVFEQAVEKIAHPIPPEAKETTGASD